MPLRVPTDNLEMLVQHPILELWHLTYDPRLLHPVPHPRLLSHLLTPYQDLMEKAANERQEKNLKLRGKRHKLSLTPATSHSAIPSR